jgi:hypothetical protein
MWLQKVIILFCSRQLKVKYLTCFRSVIWWWHLPVSHLNRHCCLETCPSVGRGAQEGRQEKVFELCHESSYRSQWVIQVWKAVRKEENGSYMLWYYYGLDWRLMPAEVCLPRWLMELTFSTRLFDLVLGFTVVGLPSRTSLSFICLWTTRSTNEMLCILDVFCLHMSKKKKTEEAMDLST